MSSWTGARSNDLGTEENWNPVALPTSADALFFNLNSGGVLTGTGTGLSADFTSNSGGAWVLQGATLTLAGQPSPPFAPFAFAEAGNLTVDGGTLIGAGGSDIGIAQGAAMTVQNGAQVSFQGTGVGNLQGETGSLLVTGLGTTWRDVNSVNPTGVGGFLFVGLNGTGHVTVTDGASVIDSAADALGANPGSAGDVTVSAGGSLQDTGLVVGGSGNAALTVNGGTVATSGFATIGSNTGGTGTATVTGGGIWTTTQLTVGLSGAGGLTVSNGSVTAANGLSVGANAGGVGSLAVQAGGTVTNNGIFTFAGASAGSDGTISVSGTGALLNGSASFIVGNFGTGVATVSDGGVVNAGTQIAVGQLNQSNGSLTIQSGGIVTGTGVVNVGNTAGSNGQLAILAGGTLALTGAPQTAATAFRIGLNGASTDASGNPIPAAHGAVTVAGAGALLDVGGNALSVGGGTGGTGSLTIAQGGAVTTGSADSSKLAALSFANSTNDQATVVVEDAGSRLTANGFVNVGRGGTANLTIENGATMVVNDAIANGGGMGIGAGRGVGPNSAANIGGSGTATVASGSVLDVNSTVSGMTIGGNGVTGTLGVTNGGTVLAGTGMTVGTATSAGGTIYGGTGTLSIGAGGVVRVKNPIAANGYDVVIGGANSSIGTSVTGTATDAATGDALVSGTGALLDATGMGVAVGLLSNGRLTISQGGTVLAGSQDEVLGSALSIGRRSTGSVTITDPGSSLIAKGLAYVARAGNGSLTIESGGTLTSLVDPTGFAGISVGGTGRGVGPANGVTNLVTGGSGSALVTTGGSMFSQQTIQIGSDGTTGELTINQGGTVEAGTQINIGNSVSVAAGDTILTPSGSFVSGGTLVGSTGTVNVGPGGVLRAGGNGSSGTADIVIGTGVGSTGVMDVAGAGAIVDSNGGTIVIGGAGTGTLDVSAGGLVNAGAGDIDIAEQAGGNGQLTVGQNGTIAANVVNVGAAGAISLAGGTLKENAAAAAGLNNGTISGFGTWSGQLTNGGTVVASNGTLEFAGSIDGAGGVTLATGSTLKLDGAVGAGQSITFGAGTPETLILGAPGSALASPIQDFTDGDRIEFGNGMTITSASVVNNNTIVASFISGATSGTYDLLNVGFAAASSEALTTGIDTTTGDSYIQVLPAIGSGSRTLVLSMSEDSYLGDAQFTVAVDGVQVGGTFTAAAPHSSGATQEFGFKGDWTPGPHSVSVNFLNDAWGGTATTDRNLYVDSVVYEGTNTDQDATFLNTGAKSFRVTDGTPPATVITGDGTDTLVLSMSEDYYQGDAQFTVAIDGRQLGGTFTTTALHASGPAQEFTFKGNFGPGQHTVAVDFLNDAWGGTPTTDRNLYVNDVTYDGMDTKQNAVLLWTGTAPFRVTDSTAPAPVTFGSGTDTLVLSMSEDYYQGDAQFTVSIDGKQLGDIFTTTALHSPGATQNFTFNGDFGSGQHTVSVDFLNDAWGGTPETDRNLYVDDIVYKGTDTHQSTPFLNTGAKTFVVTGGTTPSVSETGDHGSLRQDLSQTGTYMVGGDTFVLTTGNAASVTLSTGTSQINFIGAGAIRLTGGSGQATVTADAGDNSFVTGTGTLNVAGGGDADAYVYHAHSGALTIADFSLAKGDTLTVDAALQASLSQTSDGQGGTLLTFSPGHSVDLHGVAALPGTGILWA
jgi:T5SS/PEP-CTERM-associated repeat protein